MLVGLLLTAPVDKVSAQEMLKFDSLYQVRDGLEGHARFEYLTDKDGSVSKQGPFNFVSKQIDTTCATTVRELVWQGTYQNNRKTDHWEYLELTQHVVVTGIRDTFNVDHRLLTTRDRIRASFDKGMPNGEWGYSIESFENGKAKTAANTATVRLQMAKTTGRFKASGTDEVGHTYLIEGDADNGLMVGDWIFIFISAGIEVEEKRHYTKGFLETLVRRNMRTGDTLDNISFPLSSDVRKAITGVRNSLRPADTPLSLNFSDGYPKSSYYFVIQQEGNHLLDMVLKQLFRNEDGVFERYGLPLGTNRMINPLSNSEKEMLAQWPHLVDGYRDAVLRLASMQEEFGRFSDNDTLAMIQNWTAIQENVIADVTPWSGSFAHNEIEFYDRKGMLLDHAVQTLLADTIGSSEDPIVLTYGLSEKGAGLLQFVTANLSERADHADSLEVVYRKTIKGLALDESVISLSLRIDEEAHRADSIVSKTDIDLRILPFAERLKRAYMEEQLGQAKSRFKDFTGPKELQRELGDSIITASREMVEILGIADRIYRRADAIDTLFIEYVFDPYTFNDRFPRRIKRKLYQFTAEETFILLMEEALKAPDAASMRLWLERTEATQRRLVGLLNDDTARLERRIRSKMSLEVRLELLGID